MSIDRKSLDLVLSRIEATVRSSSCSENIFEIRKVSKNLEFAQRSLLQLELDDPDLDLAKERRKIRDLKQDVVDKQTLIELAQEDLEEVEEEVTKQTDVSDHCALSTHEHILQNHREAQEAITDDLLQMATTLRQNQTKFGEAILKDNSLIEKTAEALNVNAGRMKTTGTKLSEYSRKSTSMCWLSVGAVVVAVVAFFITIGLIRVT